MHRAADYYRYGIRFDIKRFVDTTLQQCRSLRGWSAMISKEKSNFRIRENLLRKLRESCLIFFSRLYEFPTATNKSSSITALYLQVRSRSKVEFREISTKRDSFRRLFRAISVICIKALERSMLNENWFQLSMLREIFSAHYAKRCKSKSILMNFISVTFWNLAPT